MGEEQFVAGELDVMRDADVADVAPSDEALRLLGSWAATEKSTTTDATLTSD